MKRRISLFVATFSLAVISGSASASAAQIPPTFSYAGHCTELQLGVPANDAALREMVPAPFTPLGSPLQPIVTLGVANCDATTADGQPIPPWTGGLAGTPIVPTGTGAAFERYWLWNVGNSPKVEIGFDRVGLRTAFVPKIRLGVDAGVAGFRAARAEVPWKESPYSLESSVAESSAAPLAGTSLFWHRGRHGLVKVTYEISNGSVLSGTGSVQTPAGSPLARLVGTNSTGIAVLITFDFESTAEVVG